MGATAGYWRNLRYGTRNDDATYSASRAGAAADWDAWRAGVSLQQPLAGGWIAAFRAEGQYADEPLIPGEQFGLGGARTVRGD